MNYSEQDKYKEMIHLIDRKLVNQTKIVLDSKYDCLIEQSLNW